LVLGIILAVALSVEIFCRVRFSLDIALIRDPDHRLSPNTTETNSDGIRCAVEPAAFQPGDINFIFLGDSFVYGYHDYPQLAMPQQLERMLRERHAGARINVANFGWESSSPVLDLRILQDIGKHYSPDVVFLCLDMTDFHDDLKYQYILRRPWNLRLVPGLTTALSKSLRNGSRSSRRIARLYQSIFGFPPQRFFIVGRPLEQSRYYCSPMIRNIDAIAAFTKERLGARFFVLVFPRSFQYSARECPFNWEAGEYDVLGQYSLEPFRLMEDVGRSKPYPIYSLLSAFQNTTVFPTCLYRDPHWTEKGAHLAAQAVLEIVEKEGLLPRE
jgi:lysophospholipase L1-like esterase